MCVGALKLSHMHKGSKDENNLKSVFVVAKNVLSILYWIALVIFQWF